jgi:hypothetical protein
MKYNFKEQELYNFYINENFTLKQLVEHYKVPLITIQRALKKYNIRKLNNLAFLKLEDNILKIKEMLLINTHQEIANYFKTSKDNIRKVIYSEINPKSNIRYSNSISEEWINYNNPLFWYFVGIITTDGHICSKSNSVIIFQQNVDYLTNIKQLISHNGKLYKSNKMYSLHITNEKLYLFFKNNNFDSDKRYSVPYIKDIPDNMFKYYLLGLFDGDGCLHYNYTSGMFKSKVFQITSGSLILLNCLNSMLLNLDYNCRIANKVSTVGNKYADLVITETNDILRIMNWLYDENAIKFCLKRKYISYLKLIKLIEIDNLKI